MRLRIYPKAYPEALRIDLSLFDKTYRIGETVSRRFKNRFIFVPTTSGIANGVSCAYCDIQVREGCNVLLQSRRFKDRFIEVANMQKLKICLIGIFMPFLFSCATGRVYKIDWVIEVLYYNSMWNIRYVPFYNSLYAGEEI